MINHILSSEVVNDEPHAILASDEWCASFHSLKLWMIDLILSSQVMND